MQQVNIIKQAYLNKAADFAYAHFHKFMFKISHPYSSGVYAYQ
jgi:hypothetical protein